MSFVSRARVFARTCNFVVQTSNVNKITPNSIVDHVRMKGFPSVSQLRLQSTEDSHIKTIYEGKLSKNIKYVKIFSLSTSLLGLLAQPYILPKVVASQSTIATAGVVIMTGFFAFGTPFILHLITSKYVTRIQYDEQRDVYIATVFTILVKEKKVEFTPDDVTKPGMREMLTTCYINDTPVFFDFENFTEISHYSRILGYDKPLDLQLETPANPELVSSDKPKKD